MTINDETPAGGLYRIVWRWHFYAGLFTAPVLVVLALTGAIYLFRTEIESWLYSDMLSVDAGPPVPVSLQEASVVRTYPGATIKSFAWARAPGQASEWAITTADGQSLSVFVDPGTAAVTGSIDAELRAMSVVRDIHAGLFMGDTGRYIVELAACWGVILLVTGAFLWWPRGGRGAGAALVPRAGAKGRLFWKDMHAVLSVWNLPLVAFLILSGLPWSIFWGVQVAKFGTLSSFTAPTPNFSDQPLVGDDVSKPSVTAHHHEDEPWAIRNAPAPEASGAPGRIGIDAVLDEARARNIAAPGLRVFYPRKPRETFVLSYVPSKAEQQRTVNIDPANGAIVRDIGWNGYSALGMAAEFGVMAHMGEQFGLINQLVMLSVCLLLIFTITAGIVMWWRRRPAGSLGAPQVPTGASAGWTVAAAAIGLGALMPLAGASMLAIALIEIFAARRRAA